MRRRLLPLVAISLSLLAGGCGSAGSPAVSSPLATELSYFPAGTLFLATIATDPHGAAVQNANALLGAFPLAKLGIDALESNLASRRINYQSDIEPLYGNPIVFGALKVSSPSRLTRSSFLGAWITKSASKLDALVKGAGLAAQGSVDGATLYHSGSTTLAVDGATVVLGSSAALITAALDRHAHGGGMTSADFSKATGNLPGDALVRAFGTLTGVLATSQAGSARSIPWVGAIRGYAASLSATGSGLTAQFHLDTSGGALTTSELPIAPGSAPPELAGSLPIAVGVRDPAQTISFILAAERTVDPAAYARFTARENAAKRKAGFDLSTFASLLTGNLIVQSDAHTTMGRADVSDRATAARQLAMLPQVVRDIFPTVKGVTREPDGFYAIKLARGRTLTLGLVGNEFVAGVATPGALRAFAVAPATPAPNAQGSVAFRISLLSLLRLAVKGAPSTLIQSVLSTVGDITGSASASPSAVMGQLTLGVK